MKSLAVMRHAKAEIQRPGMDDFGRTLNDRGRRDATDAAAAMIHHDWRPNLVLCSTSARTRETWSQLANAGLTADHCEFLDDLYLAPASLLLSTLKARGGDHDRVLILAHNPGVESLAEVLARKAMPFPTSAVALFELSFDQWSAWNDSTISQLEWSWTPQRA